MSYTELSKHEVIAAISKSLNSDDFTLIKSKLETASEDIVGFLGLHLKLFAKIKVDGKYHDVQYFVKKLPVEVELCCKHAVTTKVFFKEIFFYRRIVFDIKSNLSLGRKLTKWCPQFLYGKGEEIIILEDMTARGYGTFPKRMEMDLEYILAAIRALAAMHSCSMILEEKLKTGTARSPPKGWSKSKFTNIGDFYSEIRFESELNPDPSHPGHQLYEAGIKGQLTVIDLLPEYTADQREKIKRKLPTILKKIYQYVEPSKVFRNVWTHGDVWSNNVMFKKNKRGKVKNAVLIDFQHCRYTPPATDVMLFLHLVQDQSFRTQHLTSILEAYYKGLTEEANAEGYDVNALLSKNEFFQSCEFYDDFGVIAGTFYSPLIFTTPEITDKYFTDADLFEVNVYKDRSAMIKDCYHVDETFRRRVTNATEELIERYELAN